MKISTSFVFEGNLEVNGHTKVHGESPGSLADPSGPR